MSHRRRSANKERPLLSSDKLQPALLDRLTDEFPNKRTEAVHQRTMNADALRKSVLRDLLWLLNTPAASSEIDFAGLGDARHSVINFGVASVSGRVISEVEWHVLERSLHEAISIFEPRIDPQTLKVQVIHDDSEKLLDRHNIITLEIGGVLLSNPYPVSLLLRSRVDLESGQTTIDII
jgi:type VI secretion system lysozyme-related protein